MSMAYITPNKTLLTTAVKAVVAREAAAPSAGASKIAPGVSAPGHPQTNGEGAGATRAPLARIVSKREPEALSLIRSETSLIR